ncbi:hypothetical protein HII28_00395 [Planctomonas sp. JC2975]|uniref:phage upper tail fiber protein n=1 Tax=Planctomonas sp. JC2975 TaxID=2729626 RepID=UPI001472A324|nr:hypothetical protein [Planctomonas sp. JC2975]NNC10344.1 hypothetical protein [Planctomonas sp. JC2975]
MDWYTTDTIRADWKDAPSNDSVLEQLLEVAKAQVLAYDNGYNWRLNSATSAAAFPGDYITGAVPASLVMGQRMQLRNLWNANRVDPANASAGDDTFQVRIFPMDWVVKQVIRPKKPFGSFGDGSSSLPAPGGEITNIVSLTQAEYDAITVKDPHTLYLITDQADA